MAVATGRRDKKALWVYASHRDGKLDPVVLELLGKGAELADRGGLGVEAIVLAGPRPGWPARVTALLSNSSTTDRRSSAGSQTRASTPSRPPCTRGCSPSWRATTTPTSSCWALTAATPPWPPALPRGSAPGSRPTALISSSSAASWSRPCPASAATSWPTSSVRSGAPRWRPSPPASSRPRGGGGQGPRSSRSGLPAGAGGCRGRGDPRPAHPRGQAARGGRRPSPRDRRHRRRRRVRRRQQTELGARRRTGRPAQRRGRGHPPAGRRGLGRPRADDRRQRQGDRAAALHRRRHLGNDAPHRGHPPGRDHSRDQQRPARADLRAWPTTGWWATSGRSCPP